MAKEVKLKSYTYPKNLIYVLILLTVSLFSVACSPSLVEQSATIDAPQLQTSSVVVGSELASISMVTTQTENGSSQTREMMTCMAREPQSLYIYSGNPNRDLGARSASILQMAMYERMYVMISGEYEARGLTHIPTPDSGDVIYKQTTVQTGDWVIDANNELIQLTEGATLLNASGEPLKFEGTAVSIPQMQVTFTLQPFIWSDGTPVTAEDSVFSFEIASDPATPMSKERIQRTASYESVGKHSVQWLGIPGNISEDYVQNIWTPLPKHQLGFYSAEELLTLDHTSREPISYGRFIIESWVPGSHITLISNPHYYALDQAAPTQRLIYEFLEPDAGF